MRWSLDESPTALPADERLALSQWIRAQGIFEAQPLLPGTVGSKLDKMRGGHLLVPTPIIHNGKAAYILQGPVCANVIALFKYQGAYPRVHEAFLCDRVTKLKHEYSGKQLWNEFAEKFGYKVVTILYVNIFTTMDHCLHAIASNDLSVLTLPNPPKK